MAYLNHCKKRIIFDCSHARRFWTGRFSVTYQSRVADLMLQQLAVVFSCHELLFYLTTDFFFPPPFFGDRNHCMSTKFSKQLIQSRLNIKIRPSLHARTVCWPSKQQPKDWYFKYHNVVNNHPQLGHYVNLCSVRRI